MKHKIFEDFKLRKINKKDLNQICSLLEISIRLESQ